QKWPCPAWRLVRQSRRVRAFRQPRQVRAVDPLLLRRLPPGADFPLIFLRRYCFLLAPPAEGGPAREGGICYCYEDLRPDRVVVPPRQPVPAEPPVRAGRADRALRAWKASDPSVRAFCAAGGLNEATFYARGGTMNVCWIASCWNPITSGKRSP